MTPLSLAQSLTHVTALDQNLIADVGALEDGWLRAANFMLPDSTVLTAALERQAAAHPNMESRTKGSYFMGEYVWYVIAPAIATFMAERRVPDLSPENIALRWQRYPWQHGDQSGEADRMEVRFLSERCSILPHDALEMHAAARIVTDTHTLRDTMRTALEAHFTPLIEQVYQQTKLSRHALWCIVADTCASLFLYLGQAMGRAEDARGEGLAFIKAAGSPMSASKTHYITLEVQGHCDTFTARGGCCRYYTVSDTGEKCSTCVLRTPEERDQRLLDYMSRKYAQESFS